MAGSFVTDEISSLIHTKFMPSFADQVTKSNPVLSRFWARRETLGGGRTFTYPIMVGDVEEDEGGYFDETTQQFLYGKHPDMNVATFRLTNLHHPVQFTYTELMEMGSDEVAAVRLVRARLEIAKRKFLTRMSKTLWQTAGSGARGQLGVMDALAQSGTYGNINRDSAANAFWLAPQTSMNASSPGTATALTLPRLDTAMNVGEDYGVEPDFYVTDRETYIAYRGKQYPQVRFADAGSMNAGGWTQEGVYFNGKPVIYDPRFPNDGLDGNSKTKRKWIGVNLETWHFVVVGGGFMASEVYRIPGTPKYVMDIVLRYNLACNIPRWNPVCTDIDASA